MSQPIRHPGSGVSLDAGRSVWAAPRRGVVPTRLLDMIPGGLAWLALASVLVGAVVAPVALIWAATLLAAYTAQRFGLAGAASVAGLRTVRRWAARDWALEYARRATPASLPLDVVHHVVIIPNYQESIDLLRRTLRHLARQVRAAESMSVVLAMESREEGAPEKAAQLQREFAARFAHVFVVSHPRGIPGEAACKSANLSWAARWVKRLLVDEMGYRMKHLVVTSMDADTTWHPRYFEALSVLFATDPRRYSTYWQAPIRYHGNVWRINPLMRILHAYSSAWELAYLAAPWWRALPMSSYSISLRLLDSAGYWDPDAIADEWHMFIKSFFQRSGSVRVRPVFLPFWANATTGHGLAGVLKQRYLQTLRHAWGAKEIGYTLGQWIDTPRRPVGAGLGLLLRVAHDNLLAGAGWVIMMLGAQVPVLLHPALLHDARARLALIVLQAAITLITALTVLFWALDVRLRPRRPTPWTLRGRLYELASLPLLAVITFVCVTLPVLHAQTQLLLGIPLTVRVTPKN